MLTAIIKKNVKEKRKGMIKNDANYQTDKFEKRKYATRINFQIKNT